MFDTLDCNVLLEVTFEVKCSCTTGVLPLYVVGAQRHCQLLILVLQRHLMPQSQVFSKQALLGFHLQTL